MFDLTPFESRNHRSSMSDFFNELDKHFLNKQTIFNFSTDIKEEDDKFVLEAEIPGFEKDEIKIDLNEDRLTISAQHKEETTKENEKEDDEQQSVKVNYIHKERIYGCYSRSFHIANIDTEKITASYNNGILTLSLPKKQPIVPPTKQIEIE